MSSAMENTMKLFQGGMSVTGMDYIDILLRLGCALLVGMIVGWERERSHHPAGLRTNMLVCLGACIVMITAESICNRYAGISNADPARLGAQVIAGVGFLGAGTIIHKGVTVQGLTTAASIWTVACLGLAAGNGDYVIASSGAVLTTIILSVVERFSKAVFRKQELLVNMGFDTTQRSEAIQALNLAAIKYDFSIRELRMDEKISSTRVEAQLDFRGERGRENMSNMMASLLAEKGIDNLGVKEFQEQR